MTSFGALLLVVVCDPGSEDMVQVVAKFYNTFPELRVLYCVFSPAQDHDYVIHDQDTVLSVKASHNHGLSVDAFAPAMEYYLKHTDFTGCSLILVTKANMLVDVGRVCEEGEAAVKDRLLQCKDDSAVFHVGTPSCMAVFLFAAHPIVWRTLADMQCVSSASGHGFFKSLPTLYINLDCRPDRRRDTERECSAFGLCCERVAAEGPPRGMHPMHGCTLSHIKCLLIAKARGWPMVLILEDDIEFCVSAAVAEEALRPVLTGTVPFDIVMLAYNDVVKSVTPVEHLQCVGLGRPQSFLTTAAYLVHRDMYDQLLETFTTSLGDLPVDLAWLPLQTDPAVRFYYCLTRIGRQRAGYSDIERRHTNYGGV
jgi:hypothetical protein